MRSTARSPGPRRATSVLRQKRSRAYSAGTMIGSFRHAFTVKMVPVSAFSGCGPLGVEGARIAPRARPHVGHRVDLRVGVGLLVGDEGPVRLLACVDARFESGLPEHLVAAEEREMDARVPGRLHVSPLPPRPVLVVPHGEKEPVIRDEPAPPVAVDPGGVAHVVAVRLEEPHERVLRVEDRVHGPVVAGLEGAVVAHLVGPGRPPRAGAGGRDRGARRCSARRSGCRPARWCRRSGTGCRSGSRRRARRSRCGSRVAREGRSEAARGRGSRRRARPPRGGPRAG